MADKTIGELKAVPIGELPLAPDIYDETLFAVEQQAEARRISGRQITNYARSAAKQYVDTAVKAAEDAEASKKAAAESAKDAADVALHPPILKDGSDHWRIWDTELNDYKDSGVDAGVSLEVSPETITGEPGTPAKVENLGTATDPVLQFTLPQGTPGVSPTVTVTKAGGVTTVTITDATGEHTATIKDGEVTREELEEAIAEHAARSWTLEVAADKWVAGTDTWEEFTGNYKAELTAEGMTEETVIDAVNFVSGDLDAASTWVYYKPGAGTVTLWSRDKPTEDFTIRMTEVVV